MAICWDCVKGRHRICTGTVEHEDADDAGKACQCPIDHSDPRADATDSAGIPTCKPLWTGKEYVSPLDTQPELPPIIATVAAGDRLAFLTGDLHLNREQADRWRAALSDFFPDVKVTFVPAVGVVRMPAAPVREPSEADRIRAAYDLEGLQQRLNVCGSSQWFDQSFEICVKAPGHEGEHRYLSGVSLGPATQGEGE